MLLEHKSQVAAEIEASEGTAETLVAADAVLCENPTFTPNIAMEKRDPARENLSPMASIPGSRQGRIGFSSWLVGTTAAGDANHLTDILLGCGASETLVASTSATYKPDSTSPPSLTLAKFMDGKKGMIWGARGNAKLMLEAGKKGLWTFDFLGADFSDTDAALLSGVSLESTLPPVFMGATLSIDSYSAIINKVELDFGNTLALRKSAAASSGHVSTRIANRTPMLRFTLEAVLTATKNFFSTWQAGTEVAFSASLGSVAGNTIAITAPKVQYQSIKPANDNGIATFEIAAQLNGDTGDDEWQIQFT